MQFGAHAFLDWTQAEPETGGSFEDREISVLRFDATRTDGPATLVLEADVSQHEFTVHDAFLDWRLGDHGPTLRIGHFKEPNGLEQLTSMYARTFTRTNGQMKINGIDRRLGVALRDYRGPFTIEGALFASNVNEEDLANGWSASGRLAYSAGEGDHISHFGVSTRYRESDDARFGYSEDAYSFAIGKIVKTSSIGESDIFVGLEAAHQIGPFSIQAEASRTFVNCGTCVSDVELDAAYVDVSYVFGGHRSYTAHGGKFGRTHIDEPLGEGGAGAWELAARIDYVDLEDEWVLGGTQTTGLVGVNYYANENVRLQLNYAHSEIDAPTTGASRDVDAVTLRLQLDFSARH